MLRLHPSVRISNKSVLAPAFAWELIVVHGRPSSRVNQMFCTTGRRYRQHQRRNPLKKKKKVREGAHKPLKEIRDQSVETDPAPRQAALRPYADRLIREQQDQRENCFKIKPSETAAQ